MSTVVRSSLRRLRPITTCMTRTFSILALVAALTIGGFMLSAQAGRRSQEKDTTTAAVEQAGAVASTANFQQAALALQARQLESGPFAGTDLGGFGGTTLVRADAASYCVQAGTGPSVAHLAGPGG